MSKTLIDRTFKLCHNWIAFHTETLNFKKVLSKNEYPPEIVEKEIKTYLEKYMKTHQLTWNVESKLITNCHISKFSPR